MHSLDHVRRGLLEVADDALVRALVVDLRRDEVAGEQVSDDAERKLGLLVDQFGRLRALRARLDRLPEPLQEDEVALDVLCRRTLGGGTHDDAAFFHIQVLDDLLQPRALGILEPARDAESFAVRHVDQEAPRQRDLRRQPGSLRLHGILDRLHEQLLSAGDQVLDLLAVPLALELGHDDLVDVEKPVLLETDLDESGLHAREHVVDDTEIDVPGDRAPLGSLEIDLGDPVVLDHRDPLLSDVDRDEQLALRRRQRCAARGLPPALASLAALAATVGSALRPLTPILLLPRGGFLGDGEGRRCLAVRR